MSYPALPRVRCVNIGVAVILIAMAGMVTAKPVAAWNIICGISVGFTEEAVVLNKWRSDAAALAGISSFYMGLSQLQNVEVANIETGTNLDREVSKIQKAKDHFIAAREQLSVAISEGQRLVRTLQAEEVRSLGTMSLKRYAQLDSQIASFVEAIDARTLPELEKLHQAVKLTTDMISFGQEISMSHVGIMGHSLGGRDVRW